MIKQIAVQVMVVLEYSSLVMVVGKKEPLAFTFQVMVPGSASFRLAAAGKGLRIRSNHISKEPVELASSGGLDVSGTAIGRSPRVRI